MKWQIKASQEVAYEVEVSQNIFDASNNSLSNSITTKGSGRCVVFIEREVDRLWGEAMRVYLEEKEIAFDAFSLPMDERAKTLDSVTRIIDILNTFKLNRRRDQVIAIGGGVLTDVVGLATSLFRRGTSCIKVPTTLMGLIDAGIGIKTGVNYDGKKNRIGTYSAPAHVLLDPAFMTTLPKRHIANGVAEIIKIALIGNRTLFELLEGSGREFFGDAPVCGVNLRTMSIAVEDMLAQLEPNLWEHELARSVDFGHTFSPTFELLATPEMLHGEAVAIDMAFSLTLARRRGLLTSEEYTRTTKLIRDFGLPVWCSACTEKSMWHALEEATLHRDGLQRVPFTRGIGNCVFVNDITQREIASALAQHLDEFAPAT